MKHISPALVAVETQVRVPTRRALAKQQTRAKVLAAGRRLFSEQGYEGATIRDIAAAAGMSTGAVFANFTDKADLFREIMIVDSEALLDGMREAAARGRDAEDALLKVFTAGYAFYKSQLPLARAAFSVSWTAENGQVLLSLAPIQAVLALFTDQLQAGVERGELAADPNLELRSRMLFDSYLSNYRQAIFEGWTLEALQARSREQIRILLAGVRKG